MFPNRASMQTIDCLSPLSGKQDLNWFTRVEQDVSLEHRSN